MGLGFLARRRARRLLGHKARRGFRRGLLPYTGKGTARPSGQPDNCRSQRNLAPSRASRWEEYYARVETVSVAPTSSTPTRVNSHPDRGFKVTREGAASSRADQCPGLNSARDETTTAPIHVRYTSSPPPKQARDRFVVGRRHHVRGARVASDAADPSSVLAGQTPRPSRLTQNQEAQADHSSVSSNAFLNASVRVDGRGKNAEASRLRLTSRCTRSLERYAASAKLMRAATKTSRQEVPPLVELDPRTTRGRDVKKLDQQYEIVFQTRRA